MHEMGVYFSEWCIGCCILTLRLGRGLTISETMVFAMYREAAAYCMYLLGWVDGWGWLLSRFA